MLFGNRRRRKFLGMFLIGEFATLNFKKVLLNIIILGFGRVKACLLNFMLSLILIKRFCLKSMVFRNAVFVVWFSVFALSFSPFFLWLSCFVSKNKKENQDMKTNNQRETNTKAQKGKTEHEK